MKILLDECLPLDFRLSFPQHDAHSAEWAGFKGMKNGELLKIRRRARRDVLLTVDQALPQQQNLDALRLAIIVLHSVTNQLEDLLPLVIGYRSRVGGDFAGNDRFDQLGTGTFSQRPTADLLRASIVRESSTMAQGRWIPEADLKGRLEQLGASYARRKAVQ